MGLDAYIRIIRPTPSILVALIAYIGQIIALKNIPEPLTTIKIITTSFLLTASSFILNDYIDYQIDQINTPNRPIPSGMITRHTALKYGLLTGISGITSTILLTRYAGTIAITMYVLSLIYTIKAKNYGFIGNIIVALNIASGFLFGALSVKTSLDPIIIAISSICFFYVLGGELVQSIADAEGDRFRKVKSIPIIATPRTAAIIAALCYTMMGLMGAYTATLYGSHLSKYSPIIVPATILTILLINFPLLKKPDRATALKTRKMTNALAFIIITLFLVALLIQE